MANSHGCDTNGNLFSDNFAGPLPVIGIYIAGGSLLCFLAMALDFFHGVSSKKPWFPCKFFSLNSTSLTLLSIATKLPVDLNTPMPSRQDQLSKLSGTVFICTVMANFMPSLGHMGESELLSNVVAVAILVITVIVNICIQMVTGVIYIYLPEHAIIMFLMLVLLAILALSALAVPITREILDDKFNSKSDTIIGSSSDKARSVAGTERFGFMKEEVKKWWMMAYSSSHHHVLSSSDTCNAAGAFSFLSALVLVQAVVRSVFMRFCNGESDYQWSTWVVLVFQVLAVVLGNFAPLGRWLNVVKIGRLGIKEHFFVERCCLESLEEWKRFSLPFHIGNRKCRAIAHGLKNKILDIVAVTQRVLIWVSKVIRLSPLMLITWCQRFMRRNKLPISGNQPQALRDFVIHPNLEPIFVIDYLDPNLREREDEHDLVPLILKTGLKDIEEWTRKIEKNKPEHLIKLLKEKSTASDGFRGALQFDIDVVPSASVLEDKTCIYTFDRGGREVRSKKPPNCWALPVVTLASIAISIMYSDKERMKLLLQGVSQGLKFVNYIEKLIENNYSRKMANAARDVWISIDLYNRWLDVNLCDLASTVDSLESPFPMEIIEKLANFGEISVSKHKESIGKYDAFRWPVKVHAGNSLYRVCKTILHDRDKFPTRKTLVDWLEQMISDLLGDCLTTLPFLIHKGCDKASIDVREGRVRIAACLLLEAQHFKDILSLSPRENSHLWVPHNHVYLEYVS